MSPLRTANNSGENPIFERALNAYKLKPQETVFIDDVEKNVKAAARLGIRTIHLRDVAHLERELASLGVT